MFNSLNCYLVNCDRSLGAGAHNLLPSSDSRPALADRRPLCLRRKKPTGDRTVLQALNISKVLGPHYSRCPYTVPSVPAQVPASQRRAKQDTSRRKKFYGGRHIPWTAPIELGLLRRSTSKKDSPSETTTQQPLSIGYLQWVNPSRNEP